MIIKTESVLFTIVIKNSKPRDLGEGKPSFIFKRWRKRKLIKSICRIDLIKVENNSRERISVIDQNHYLISVYWVGS